MIIIKKQEPFLISTLNRALSHNNTNLCANNGTKLNTAQRKYITKLPLTDSQLTHLGHLKKLFVKDVKKLLNENIANPALAKYVENSINKPKHFINFNKTRYNYFVMEITTSRNKIQKKLEKIKATNPDEAQSEIEPRLRAS